MVRRSSRVAKTAAAAAAPPNVENPQSKPRKAKAAAEARVAKASHSPTKKRKSTQQPPHSKQPVRKAIKPEPKSGVECDEGGDGTETTLTADTLATAVVHLKKHGGSILLDTIARSGPPSKLLEPPASPSAFAQLAKMIVYQQLAGKAAATIHGRVVAACGTGGVTSGKIASLKAPLLRAAGLSERKVSYVKDLAAHFLDGRLNDALLHSASDAELASALIAVRGIGEWTCQMFMMFTLKRGNILPTGDLGVRKGMMIAFGLKKLPNREQMEEHASVWEPYRSVGSYYMWKVADTPEYASPKKKAK